MSAKIPMTAAGKAKLHAEIKQIKHVDRPKNVRDIEEARAHGDLSENAEYSAAKDKQSHIAGRLATLEDWIARAEVIDVSKLSGDKVVFGATVTLLDEEAVLDPRAALARLWRQSAHLMLPESLRLPRTASACRACRQPGTPAPLSPWLRAILPIANLEACLLARSRPLPWRC